MGDWIGHAKVSNARERMIKKGEQRERGEFNGRNSESDGESPEEQPGGKSNPSCAKQKKRRSMSLIVSSEISAFELKTHA